MSATAEAISAFLIDFLNGTPGKTLKGTQVAQVIKIAYPDFHPMNFGCYNIRNFISKYVRPVNEVGRAGADFIYSIGSPAIQAESSTERRPDIRPVEKPRSTYLEARVWKTFATPLSPFSLVANKQTGEVRVISSRGPEPAEPWVRVPSLTADFHKELASEFIGSVDYEFHRKALSDTFSHSRWWTEFYTTALRVGLARRWNSFRTRKIVQKYEDALKALDVPIVQAAGVQATPEMAPVPPRPSAAQTSQSREDSRLRKIAVQAVERMTTSELRALSIPLGYVVDELDVP